MKYLIFLLIPLEIFSQRIFVTGQRNRTDFDVIYVNNRWQADVCVNLVSYRHQAGQSATRNGCDNWFFVDNEWDADYAVRIVNNIQPGRKTIRVFLNTPRYYSPPDPGVPDRGVYDNDYYNYMIDRDYPDFRTVHPFYRRPRIIISPIFIR